MKKTYLTDLELERVRSAARMLSSNLNEHITIPKLAKMVKLPEKKLKAGFKQLFNTGVFGYYQRSRLEKVKQMIMNNEPLKAIAAETGYNDEHSLIKAFKQQMNASPTQWRKQQSKSSEEH